MDQNLRMIFSQIFEIKPEEVSSDLTPEHVDTWDSLNHLRLVTEVEAQLGVSLSMEEIESIDSFGALEQVLEARGEE